MAKHKTHFEECDILVVGRCEHTVHGLQVDFHSIAFPSSS